MSDEGGDGSASKSEENGGKCLRQKRAGADNLPANFCARVFNVMIVLAPTGAL